MMNSFPAREVHNPDPGSLPHDCGPGRRYYALRPRIIMNRTTTTRITTRVPNPMYLAASFLLVGGRDAEWAGRAVS